MTKIKLIYLAGFVDRGFNGFSHAFMVQGIREQYSINLQNKIKDIKNINEIIKIIKNDKNILTPNSVLIITIDDKDYFLDSNIELLDDDTFHRKNFKPCIEFDKSNLDANIELKRINEKIQHLCSDKAVEFIENYVVNLPKQYIRISQKPNKITLTYSYDKEPKEFLIQKMR